MNRQFIEAASVIRSALADIRAATPAKVFPRDRAASHDMRIGYIGGEPVQRLVITFRAPGCSWVEAGGGCVMCGHHAGTTGREPLSRSEAEAQFLDVIDSVDMTGVNVLSLYNSGSMLNPRECAPEALEYLCSAVRAFPSVRKVVLETRAEYVDRDRIRRLAGILGPDRTLSIAMGLETADEARRHLCFNKGCSGVDIERAVNRIRDITETQLYVFFGAPFLTEREMIDDTVAGIWFADCLGADEIHIEPATIQRHTLLALLEESSEYRLPSLYSLFEVLRSVLPSVRPYVSPFMHMPLPDRIPEGCPLCTEYLVATLLESYNRLREPGALDIKQCDCMDSWLARLAITDSRPLPERVLDTMIRLRNGVSA